MKVSGSAEAAQFIMAGNLGNVLLVRWVASFPLSHKEGSTVVVLLLNEGGQSKNKDCQIQLS